MCVVSVGASIMAFVNAAALCCQTVTWRFGRGDAIWLIVVCNNCKTLCWGFGFGFYFFHLVVCFMCVCECLGRNGGGEGRGVFVSSSLSLFSLLWHY